MCGRVIESWSSWTELFEAVLTAYYTLYIGSSACSSFYQAVQFALSLSSASFILTLSQELYNVYVSRANILEVLLPITTWFQHLTTLGLLKSPHHFWQARKWNHRIFIFASLENTPWLTLCVALMFVLWVGWNCSNMNLGYSSFFFLWTPCTLCVCT